MRASRSKKRTDGARSTQKRGGGGRARKAGAGALKQAVKRGTTGKGSQPGISAAKLPAQSAAKRSAKRPAPAAAQGKTHVQAQGKAVATANGAKSRRKEVSTDRLEARAADQADGAPVRLAADSAAGAGNFMSSEGRGAEGGAMLVPVAERGTPPPLPAPIASFVF
jgi:hypothetical protein